MALKKPTTAATPAFETEEGAGYAVENAAEAATETVATETVASPAAKVEATTAIAKAQASSVSTNVKKGFHAALTHLQDQLGIDHVRALGVGTLPKLVADRAGFILGEGKEEVKYGEYVDFEIYSFNNRWLLSTGEDSDEGKELLRTSYDNETVENEALSVRDYIQHLKDEGHKDAKSRQYIDLWGFIVNSEKEGEVSDDDKEMIQLQLSPSSVKLFTAYQLQAGIKASMGGKQPSDTVRATCENKEFKANKYAQIKFSAVPA